jgi:hypothetical protein
MRPVARSRPSAIPQERAGLPALIAMLRTPDPRVGGIPYLPIVIAAILLGFSLAYFLARGCRSEAPPERETPTITAPDTPSAAPSSSELAPEPAPSASSASSAPTPSTAPTHKVAPPTPAAPHSVQAPRPRR